MVKCICDSLFTDYYSYKLEDITGKKLPSNTGVYAIKVRDRGLSTSQTIEKTMDFLRQSNWPSFLQYAENRIKRIERIKECPILYIGAAPSEKRGLSSRYQDLCGKRHTAFYPIMALLVAGWKLDFYWEKADSREDAFLKEKQLKKNYKELHGELPALVKR